MAGTNRSGRPDAAQQAAAHNLEVRRRMRLAEEAILARAPEHDLEPSLDRIAAVMELLGDPQRSYPVIHLTGTNGKTSTTRIIESLLRELGLRTGRFTSPHLHTVRERIALSGEPIAEEKFLAAYDDVLPFIEMVDARSASEGGPLMTFFEVLVAVAYAAFADAPVDVAIVEVGMGGGWDATNVADGSVAVVTPVALDHQHFLGTTLEEIAAEKSGIIKSDAVAVVAVQEPEVAQVLLDRATEVGARIAFEGNDFGLLTREVGVGGQQISVRGMAGDYTDLFLPLHGAHQAHNAVLALAAVEAFLGGGEQRLDPEVVRAGLAAVASPGRLEIVRRSPTVIVDAAHNTAGALALRTALEDSFNFARLVGVVAILKDKPATEMLEVLEPVFDHVVITSTTSPRAMRPEDLGELAADIFGEDRVTVVHQLPDALDTAAGLADEGGVGGGVVATGSVTTAAEVRMLLGTTEV
ncbi:bifunctional folylpolyglutamate synthase/dihydrofolate synthase [Knoellia sp. 3-2P3]|uniref:bifunctional folylpolyglutamate synthase/dihydrofolate synthase n=1 Tax=unclassified Knoellia TaxID=2618719 RepID=UPI0023DB441F|nr:folylpolyglutamate synthase/dihydrofolate synthase family protein [Knoellia sp. 3-2P3]MDF2092854.1 bifunctional folylpolyglutamate synthase/dihydrofolate synthase [Knoellia sp. 3-2P3]